MKRLAAIFALLPALSQAGPYDGLCFAGGACTGQIEIRNNGFDLCEHSCVMENPVEVRGLNAMLWDVTCRGDYSTYSERMLFAWVGKGTEMRLTVLSNDTVETLWPCR